MMDKTRETHAITLIALVITVIILLILSGVVIYYTIGRQGMFAKISEASEEYANAYEKEQASLDNLYSQMLVATNDDAKITISVEDLNKLIEDKVNEKVTTSVADVNKSIEDKVNEKVTASVADLNKLIEDKVNEKVTSTIPTPDYAKRKNIAFSNKAYTVKEDGYIQVMFQYTQPVEVGKVWDKLYINNIKVYTNNIGVTWSNDYTPTFPVKKGDIITYENAAQQVNGYYYPIRY